jgi:hypothetical protein
MHALRVASAATILLVSPGGVAWSADCRADRWVVTGSVEDSTGRPVADARVRVLLDRISEKSFLKNAGTRARSALTNAAGRYQVELLCGSQPDPCAGRPKVVSVAVNAGGHRLIFKTLDLKPLGPEEDGGVCFLEMPGVEVRVE